MLLSLKTIKYAGLTLAIVAELIALTISIRAQTNAAADSRVQPAVQETNQPAVSSPSAQQTPEVLIGAGDLLEVSVLGAPDSIKQIRVGSSGEISLPLIGSVKVAGLSIIQAERTVAKRLVDGGFFSDPQVSIFEKEYATQGISVLGEVLKPGIYPLLGRHSVFDAISAAGGTTPRAGNTVSITHRETPNKPETMPLSYGPGDSHAGNNAQIMPGDIIVVSKAGIVYVVGDVGKPGGFVMENSTMTVLQAIAMAQGANQNAALNSAKLIRRASNQPQEVPIPLKQILAAKAPDMNLQPNDIVFVPNSAGKTAARKSMEAILQTATGIAIYRR
jgi:polysaccharide export outer membrane protein